MYSYFLKIYDCVKLGIFLYLKSVDFLFLAKYSLSSRQIFDDCCSIIYRIHIYNGISYIEVLILFQKLFV